MEQVLESLSFLGEMFDYNDSYKRVLNRFEQYKKESDFFTFDGFQLEESTENNNEMIEPINRNFIHNYKTNPIGVVLVDNIEPYIYKPNKVDEISKMVEEMSKTLTQSNKPNVVEDGNKYTKAVYPIIPIDKLKIETNNIINKVKENMKLETEVKMDICNSEVLINRRRIVDLSDYLFEDIFNIEKYFEKNSSEANIILTYETGSIYMKNHISTIRCAMLNNKDDLSSYGFYIVDIFYPIVYYSGNITRTLKYLKDNSQIIALNNKYNKRVVTIKGLLYLFEHFRKSKKRDNSIFSYMNIIEECILSRFEKASVLIESIKLNRKNDDNKKNSYTSWKLYYECLKNFCQTNKFQSKKLSFPKDFKDKSLIRWCITQKSNKNRGFLSDNKIKMLQELPGWHWGIYSSVKNPNSKLKWSLYFDKLKEYLKHYNKGEYLYFDKNDKQKFNKLYIWCKSQKGNKERGLISAYKIEKLNSLKGWHWNTFTKPKTIDSPITTTSESDSE